MLPIDRVIDLYICVYKKSALVMAFQLEWEIVARCGSSLIDRNGYGFFITSRKVVLIMAQ